MTYETVPSPGREVRQTSDGLLCLPCPTQAWKSVGATGRVLGPLTNPEIVFAFIGRGWRVDDGGSFGRVGCSPGHLECEKTVLAPFWATSCFSSGLYQLRLPKTQLLALGAALRKREAPQFSAFPPTTYRWP